MCLFIHPVRSLLIFFYYSLLPTPSQVVWDREDEAREQKLRQRPVSALVKAVVTAPPYGQRKGWIPRCEEVSDKFLSCHCWNFLF